MTDGPDARAAALAYEAGGSGSPVVLLHGLSGSGRWWSRNVPALAQHFRTYTVDLPGFGANRGIRWTGLDDTVDWLATWMADEGIGPAHVAGHSLGGAVAAHLAVRHPQRVDRLVLVSSAIRPRGARATMRATDLLRTIQRRSPGITAMFVRDALRRHPRSAAAATVEAIMTNWDGRLAQVAAPTLVVWGEHDPITPIARGRGIAASIPGARFVSLPKTGHNPMWEDAETFNAEVLRFLGGDDPHASPIAGGPHPPTPLSHRDGRGGL